MRWAVRWMARGVGGVWGRKHALVGCKGNTGVTRRGAGRDAVHNDVRSMQLLQLCFTTLVELGRDAKGDHK
jgi:hypothetical protein